MNQPVVYDKAKWHYDGDYPSDLDQSHAFIHSGLFLGWVVEHDMLDSEFLNDIGGSDGEIGQFKSRQVTAPKLFGLWDGALVDYMLNEEANAFAQSYFDFQTGQYLKYYDRLLSHGLLSIYHVEDTWENYDLIKRQIDKRFAEWKKKQTKQWWQFWK